MIVLFTTHCPICNMLKEALDAKNITYELREDVTEVLEHGYTHAPVLKVSGKYYSAKEALALVKSWAYETKE